MRSSKLAAFMAGMVFLALSLAISASAQDNRQQDGYDNHHGYNSDRYPQQQTQRQKPGAFNNGRARLSIGSDNVVTWDAAQSANIFVQMDNDKPKLFASGQSGSQAAPWINPGHVYKFTMQDRRGNVLAQDQVDLRPNMNNNNRNNDNRNYDNRNYNDNSDNRNYENRDSNRNDDNRNDDDRDYNRR